MKMLQFFLTSILTFFLSLTLLVAQPKNSIIDDVSMPAPNTVQFMKYQEQQVNLYHGIPRINIPLETVRHIELEHNISLSYHASGIRIGEPVSWVGMGWSLNVGGQVHRTILGLPDEGRNGYFSQEDVLLDPNTLNSQLSTDQEMQVTNGSLDAEADMFSYRCGAYSGKFYISRDAAWLIPREDVNISWVHKITLCRFPFSKIQIHDQTII